MLENENHEIPEGEVLQENSETVESRTEMQEVMEKIEGLEKNVKTISNARESNDDIVKFLNDSVQKNMQQEEEEALGFNPDVATVEEVLAEGERRGEKRTTAQINKAIAELRQKEIRPTQESQMRQSMNRQVTAAREKYNDFDELQPEMSKLMKDGVKANSVEALYKIAAYNKQNQNGQKKKVLSLLELQDKLSSSGNKPGVATSSVTEKPAETVEEAAEQAIKAMGLKL